MKKNSSKTNPLANDFIDVLESDLFKSLFDRTRIQIVLALFESGDANVSEIAATFAQDRSVISRHLQHLERAGVIESTRVSREVRYQVNASVAPEIESMLTRISNLLRACCPAEFE